MLSPRENPNSDEQKDIYITLAQNFFFNKSDAKMQRQYR